MQRQRVQGEFYRMIASKLKLADYSEVAIEEDKIKIQQVARLYLEMRKW